MMRAEPSPPAKRLTLLAAAVAFGLAGCEPEVRVVRDGWSSKMAGLADPKPRASGPNGERVAATWTIELDRFVGPQRQQHAEAFAAQMRQKGLSDVRVGTGTGTAVVTAGRFENPESREAKALLERVRRTEVDGVRLFAGAELRPVGGDYVAPVYDPMDLKQFPGMYTLQIAYFDLTAGGDFRAQAERAAKQLREEGHDAYFYHGPNVSIVGVGLMAHEEAFVAVENPMAPGTLVDVYSPMARDLRERFPHNTANRVGSAESPAPAERAAAEAAPADPLSVPDGPQASSLVRVPRG